MLHRSLTPVLREVVNGVWKKEEQLKELKRELQDVDRKILAGITAGITAEKTTDKNTVENETKINENGVAERKIGYSVKI